MILRHDESSTSNPRHLHQGFKRTILTGILLASPSPEWRRSLATICLLLFLPTNSLSQLPQFGPASYSLLNQTINQDAGNPCPITVSLTTLAATVDFVDSMVHHTCQSIVSVDSERTAEVRGAEESQDCVSAPKPCFSGERKERIGDSRGSRKK